jgi:hypothetical protein
MDLDVLNQSLARIGSGTGTWPSCDGVVIVLIDDTDNRQSHHCYPLAVVALNPQKAGSTDHSVACTPGTREEAYVGGMGSFGVVFWILEVRQPEKGEGPRLDQIWTISIRKPEEQDS